MNVSHQPNRPLRVRAALQRRDQQALGQRAQVESPVKSVRKGAQVLLGIFAKAKPVVTATEPGFQVSQHRVDPLQLRHIFGFSSCDNGALMGTVCQGESTETGQPVRENRAAWREILSRPLRDRVEREPRYRGQLDTQWVPLLAERNCGHKRHLVFRATPDLAATALTAKVGVINLYPPLQHVAGLPLHHCLHQFVVHQPCRWVAHTQVAFERKRRQSSLGLADEVDCQEPHRQGQLGALEHGASDQRRLMPTRVALKNPVPTSAQNTVRGATAARTGKALWPERTLQRLRAKQLRAVEFEELGHRQTGLKLDAIHGHGSATQSERWEQVKLGLAHHVSLAEHHY